MSLLESALLSYLLPSFFDSFISLLLVLAIFKVFKVRHPATRATFLLIPLIKPLIVLLEGSAKVNPSPHSVKPVQVSIRMPDPLNLIESPFREISSITYSQSSTILTLVVVLAVIGILIILRWAQLCSFLNSFRKKEPISESKYPELHRILDVLVEKYGVNRPKLVLSNDYKLVPFSIGQNNPIIVLSKELLDSFSEEQLEIMLAHELAHIKRRDSSFGWVTIMLRDVMFFNPLIRLIYRVIEEEREKACDLMALEKTSVCPKKFADTLLDALLLYKDIDSSSIKMHPIMTRGFLYQKSALRKRIESITNPVQRKNSTKTRRFLKGFLFFLLVYLQFGFKFTLDGMTVFLR